MSIKLGKQVYVYAAILAAWIALLGSQALVSKVDLRAPTGADEAQESGALGSAWAAESLAPVPVEPQVSDAAPSTPTWPGSDEAAGINVDRRDVSGVTALLPHSATPDAPAGDLLREWIVQNPLTAIAICPSRGIAAFGGQLYFAGDELPEGLGVISQIEARCVVLLHRGAERRIPLSAFVPRAIDPAPPAQAPGAVDADHHP